MIAGIHHRSGEQYPQEWKRRRANDLRQLFASLEEFRDPTAFAPQAEPEAYRALRIDVDQQCARSELRESRGQVDGRCRFAYATFLADDGERPTHVRLGVPTIRRDCPRAAPRVFAPRAAPNAPSRRWTLAG